MIEIIARKNSSEDTNGDNSYAAFKHLYESVCENCNEAGEDGRRAMANGMSDLKKEQMELITNRGGTSDVGGVASMPATSTKKLIEEFNQSVVLRKKR